MKTLFIIANVKTIFNIKNPIVVFENASGDDVVRTPKQAFTDLQNSGRALKLPANALDRGVEGLNPIHRELFIDALYACIGAQCSGDITPVKAGDTYVATATSSVIANKEHKLFGKVKIGDTVTIEEDSSPRVEGFLSIPKTMLEKQVTANAELMAVGMFQMFGLQAVAQPIAIDTNPFADKDAEPVDAFTEGTGNLATAKKGKK